MSTKSARTTLMCMDHLVHLRAAQCYLLAAVGLLGLATALLRLVG